MTHRNANARVATAGVSLAAVHRRVMQCGRAVGEDAALASAARGGAGTRRRTPARPVPRATTAADAEAMPRPGEARRAPPRADIIGGVRARAHARCMAAWERAGEEAKKKTWLCAATRKALGATSAPLLAPRLLRARATACCAAACQAPPPALLASTRAVQTTKSELFVLCFATRAATQCTPRVTAVAVVMTHARAVLQERRLRLCRCSSRQRGSVRHLWTPPSAVSPPVRVPPSLRRFTPRVGAPRATPARRQRRLGSRHRPPRFAPQLQRRAPRRAAAALHVTFLLLLRRPRWKACAVS